MSLAPLKKAVFAAPEEFVRQAVRLSDAIWEFAEEPFLEFQSAALMREILEGQGFRVEQEFASIPTAFAMAAGSGGPRIGILAEYDALPDCGLEEGTFGHGCGHNLLGAGSALAAMLAAHAMKERGLKGTVVLYGCPAEETLAGKAYMARDGAFADLDAAIGWHPGTKNQIAAAGGSAIDSMSFEFFGRTAHGASAHGGRSALDAAELMDHAVNILREHMQDNVRIHSVITEGGGAPNVVPAYARSWYYVRGKDRAQVDEMVARVVLCARGACTATETKFKKRLLAAIYSRLPNDAFADFCGECLKAVGPVPFDAADKRAAKKLGADGEFAKDISERSATPGRASSDEDTVSWLAPLGRFNFPCRPEGVRGHHRDNTRLGKAKFAHKGMVHAGRAMALAALGLMADRKALGKIKREFAKKTKDFTFDPLLPKRQLPPLRDRIPERVPTAEDGGQG